MPQKQLTLTLPTTITQLSSGQHFHFTTHAQVLHFLDDCHQMVSYGGDTYLQKVFHSAHTLSLSLSARLTAKQCEGLFPYFVQIKRLEIDVSADNETQMDFFTFPER